MSMRATGALLNTVRSRFQISHLFVRPRRNRLIHHYFLISVLLIAGGLITSAALEIYFRYFEIRDHIALLQQESAEVAAIKIDRFVRDVETALKAAAKGQDITSQGIAPNYEFELKRLFFLVPAIADAVVLTIEGIEIMRLSRFHAALPGSMRNFSNSPSFLVAKQGRTYFGPVYLLRNSEPYMAIAVPIEHFKGRTVGVLQAEISLKFIWEVVAAIKAGLDGYAYVASRSGNLIAHPDTSLVLRGQNISHLEQVRELWRPDSKGQGKKLTVAFNLHRKKVISSAALIPDLGWGVFVERPVEEVYETLSASLSRTSTLLLIGLVMALIASFFLERRVVKPLKALGEGVQRIAGGELDFRLEVKTGDELENLADKFNDMAVNLREAYSDLERKIAERTKQLTATNEKLAKASAHKSRFLANVNHELRTPVSAIIGYAHLLRRKIAGQIPKAQREYLDDLLNNAERLLSQIDSLLDLAKIEVGKIEVRVEPVAVDEVIAVTATTIAPMLNPEQVRFVRQVAPSLPLLHTDREKLEHILLNLLGNAVKFTERGEIKIAAAEHNGGIKFAVSDTGIGIKKENLERIFEEFERGEPSPAQAPRGTGLGLAIVKELVQLLGGEIGVQSKPGQGSTFTVVLPWSLGECAPRENSSDSV